MAGQTRQTRRTLYGALLIAGLLAAAVLIFFLDAIIQSLEREYTIYAVIGNAPGLGEESPVWLGGARVGTVSAIGLMPAGGDTLSRVVVELTLPVDVRDQVRRDSEVRVTSVNLMSEKAVDISPGSAAAAVLAPGDTLRQALQPGPRELAARAAVVKVQLDSALAGVQAQMPEIRARLLQTQQAFAGFDGVLAEADRLRLQLERNPGLVLLRDPGFAASLDNVQAHVAALPGLLETMRNQPGAASETRAALRRFQLRSDSLRVQLAQAAAMLDNPNGTLARMQQDTALTRAVNAARAELDSLLADIRRNPLRYGF